MKLWQLAALRFGGCAMLAGTVVGCSAVGCGASYTIDLTVQLGSELTQGGSDLMIELRQGVVGKSTVFGTKRFSGRSGTVTFGGMCAGDYFIAIGNGDQVAVGPVRRFQRNQSIHTQVTLSSSGGNVDRKQRGNL